MRTLFRSGLSLLATGALLAACSESTAPARDGAEDAARRPSLAISDAANGGREGVYLLPPLVASPGVFTGTFDPGVAATARVCAPAPACGTTLASWTVGGAGATAITVDATRQWYAATWAAPAGLTTGTAGAYRLELFALGGTTRIAYADLYVATSAAGLRNAPPGYAGVVRGASNAIRFRLETRAVGAVTVSPSAATVTAGGTQTFTADVTDLHGNAVASPTVAWASSNAAVATVSPGSGTSTTATGVADGSADVVATSGGVSGSAALTVSSTQAPAAQADAYQVAAGASLTVDATTGVLTNDARGTPPADVVTFGGGTLGGAVGDHAAGSTATFGTGGALTIHADGSLAFTPATGFVGPFTVQYRITNAAGSAEATVTIDVQGAAPSAADDAYNANAGSSITVNAAGGLLTNDSRGTPAADVVTFGGGTLGGAVGDHAAGSTATFGTGGALTIHADGSLAFTPATGFVGPFTVQYRITNAAGSAEATVTINVIGAGPVAVVDAYTATLAGTLTVPPNGVLANDDVGTPNAQITTFGGGHAGGTVATHPVGTTVDLGNGGSLTLAANGGITFTRPAGFVGEFQFQYRIANVVGSSDATVTITVPRAPDAVDDTPAAASAPGQAYHTALNTALTIPGGASPSILANDERGYPLANVVSFGGGSLGGTVDDNPAGSSDAGVGGTVSIAADGTVSFTPASNFTGLFTVQYRLQNAHGSDVATLTIAVGQRPAVTNDTYGPALVGNVPVNTAASSGFSVLTNDQGDQLVVTPGTATHGTVALDPATGRFQFVPERGYEGPASFTYSVANGFGTGGSATVALTVSGMAWFVDASAAGGGTGTYLAPYNTLAAFAAVNDGNGGNPQAGDRIHLAAGAYTGPLPLLNGQHLVGQGAAGASFAALAGLTWPADAPAQPAIGGTAPTITASGNGITLASGNTVRGVTLGNATGAALAGTNFGTLTIAQLSINSTGQALALQNGTIDGDFAQLRSTGGATNVTLVDVATAGGSTTELGTAADALSGATGDGLAISGGAGRFTYAGTIANASASGYAVNVAGKTGGAVTVSGSLNPGAPGRGVRAENNAGTAITFSGAEQRITASGATHAVTLANNGGSTIDFTGGALTVGSDDGDAFRAVGGGTVRVTGGANTLAATGGTALRVSDTNIGSGGLTFRRIDANGGTNGIFLSNTGANGLTVTGSSAGNCGGDANPNPGAAAPYGSRTVADASDCTGGAILNTVGGDNSTSGIGVYLNNAANVSLTRVRVGGTHANYGIRGSGVTGLTLDNVLVDGTSGDNVNVDDAAVAFTGLAGSASIVNSTFGGGVEDDFRVRNDNNVTLNRLTFDNVTFTTQTAANASDALAIINSGGGTLNVTIQNSRFMGARGDMFQVVVDDHSTSDVVVSNTVLFNQAGSIVSGGGGAGVAVGGSPTDASTLTYAVTNNRFRGASGAAFYVQNGVGAGTATGSIVGNRIGDASVPNSGSSVGTGITVIQAQRGKGKVLIDQNTIVGYNGNSALWLLAGGAAASGGPNTGSLHATVRRNTISNPGTNNPGAIIDGLRIEGGSNSGDAYTVCLNVGQGAGNANSIATAGRGPDGLPYAVLANALNANVIFKLLGYPVSTHVGTAAHPHVQSTIGAANGGVTGYHEMPSSTTTHHVNGGLGVPCDLP